MYQQIAIHLFARQVINTACSIGDVSHHDCLDFDTWEFSKDVADDACEKHQSLWELERDFESWLIEFLRQNFYAVESFIDFEIIMRGKDGDGIC